MEMLGITSKSISSDVLAKKKKVQNLITDCDPENVDQPSPTLSLHPKSKNSLIFLYKTKIYVNEYNFRHAAFMLIFLALYGLYMD